MVLPFRVGTRLRSGDRLRVSTQLVEVPAGTLAWSHTTESQVGEVFRLQDELAQGIVASLSRSLDASPRTGRPGETPASARAYEFYLRANEVGRDMSQLPVARDLYLRCLAENPGFAPAWARLGRAHRMIGKYLEIPELATHQARAEEALGRALELSLRLPLAHKLYAHLESELGRAQEAMVRLARLAGETRNDAELFAGLVHACRYSGLLDASLAAHREAQRLDPHLPTGVVHTLWQRGEFERVLEQERSQGQSSRSRLDGERRRPPRARAPRQLRLPCRRGAGRAALGADADRPRAVTLGLVASAVTLGAALLALARGRSRHGDSPERGDPLGRAG